MIEHCGEFRVTFLAMSEIPSIVEALEQVMKDHGLNYQSLPVQRFTLPLTAWREGMM